MITKKVYEKINDIPVGRARGQLTKGCLVIEGGAFRGLYNQGVMDFFMENNLNFECVIGVSAGAMAGLNYAAGQVGKDSSTPAPGLPVSGDPRPPCMSGRRTVYFPALEISFPCFTAVAYGILHDMGMEGPIIRIVCIPEHGIKKPVGGKPVFGRRHGELNALHL